jgi:Spy/CpxP family protein refolding chaperone
MKLSKVSLALCVATGSLALNAGAQSNSVSNAAASNAAAALATRPAMRADGQVAFLSRQLNLTEEQKPKVKAVIEDQMKIIQGTPREHQREKFADVQAETARKMKAILTPEQYAKYEAMPQMRGPGPRPMLRTNSVAVPSGQPAPAEKKAPAKP